jgi:hypothetical protein
MAPAEETVIPMTKSAISLFVLSLSACSSPTPATSSSSHWVACNTVDECASVAGAVACTGGYCVDSSGQKIESGGSSTPGPCDPLAPHELPVTLGTVLGVGKDAQATTYVADEVPGKSISRVFVSDGTTLFRKRVTGSGSSGGGADADYSFTFEDGATTQALLVQRRGGVATGMALGPAGGKGFIGDPGATTEMLAVQGDGAVSAFTLRNLPGEVTVEYVADVTDGTVLVVTRPADDWEYADFRLFYGNTAGDMIERQVVNVLRSRSGGTDIEFKVNDATYTVRFTWILEATDAGGTNSRPGQATLETGAETIAVNQRFPTPTALTDFSFSCR